jgi:hypothetical protein
MDYNTLYHQAIFTSALAGFVSGLIVGASAVVFQRGRRELGFKETRCF